MSAYVVGKPHIDALVTAAVFGASDAPRQPPGWSPLRWWASDPREPRDGELYTDYFASVEAVTRRAEASNMDEVGAMLIAENLRSVKYRYDGSEDLPGPADPYYLEEYHAPSFPRRHLTAVEALKAIAGYEYQACEHPGWRDSEARRFCDALRVRLVSQLPGYEAANTWEVR